MHAEGGHRLARLVALAIVSWLAVAAPLAAQTGRGAAGPYQGRRVVDVLAQLQGVGVRIIFSSSLVSPTLLVKTEPKGRTPRQLAVEVLAQHGLALKDGPGGTWLVIKAPPASATTARPPAKTPAVKTAPPPTAVPDELLQAMSGPPIVPHIEEQVDVTMRLGEFAGQPSVKSMSASAVRETAGGLENILQVLPLLPGVAATDDEQGKLAVRGAGPQHNVILYDGVQVHSPQRLGDFTSSFINPAVAAGVALDASGLDARHGGRLSSVLVLETRDGRTDRRFAFSGSAGLTNGDILLEGRLPGTREGSWWVTARGTYYRYVADRFQDGTVPNFSDLQFKVTLKPSAQTRLSLVGLVGQEGLFTPYRGDPLPDWLPGNILQEAHSLNRMAAANFWWTPSGRVTTTTTVTAYANASGYQDYLEYGDTQPPDVSPVGPFDRRVRVVDLAVRQRVAVVWSPGHTLDAGVEVRRLRNVWTMTGAVRAPWTGTVSPNTWGELIDYSNGPIDARLARTQVGTWLQERIPLGAGLTVEPGLRLDWNSFTGERALQPRLRVTRRLGETLVWGGAAWQAQTPGHETMQQGFQFFDFSGPDAANLRNERSRQIVVGVERALTPGIGLRVEAYRRWFDRLLVQRQETEGERRQRLSIYELPPDMPSDSVLLEHRPTAHPQSIGTGRSTGLEVLLQGDRGRLTGWIAYTLSRAERELYGRTVPFDFDRRHAIAAVAHVQLKPSIRLSATQQLASGFPATPPTREVMFTQRPLPDGSIDPLRRAARNTDGNLVTLPAGYPFRLSRQNSVRTRSYARTDVRVTWSPGQTWELYGEVLNLFGRENFVRPFGTERPEDGSYGNIGFHESLPRLPTYGVRVKF